MRLGPNSRDYGSNKHQDGSAALRAAIGEAKGPAGYSRPVLVAPGVDRRSPRARQLKANLLWPDQKEQMVDDEPSIPGPLLPVEVIPA